MAPEDHARRLSRKALAWIGAAIAAPLIVAVAAGIIVPALKGDDGPILVANTTPTAERAPSLSISAFEVQGVLISPDSPPTARVSVTNDGDLTARRCVVIFSSTGERWDGELPGLFSVAAYSNEFFLGPGASRTFSLQPYQGPTAGTWDALAVFQCENADSAEATSSITVLSDLNLDGLTLPSEPPP